MDMLDLFMHGSNPYIHRMKSWLFTKIRHLDRIPNLGYETRLQSYHIRFYSEFLFF